MTALHMLQEYIDALQDTGLLLDSTVTDVDNVIDCFSYDNRAVSGTALFFCKGAHFKEEYLRDALSRGAVAYVADHAYDVDAPRLCNGQAGHRRYHRHQGQEHNGVLYALYPQRLALRAG